METHMIKYMVDVKIKERIVLSGGNI